MTRLDEIKGMLNAYGRGWISYDQAHVKELQIERVKLEKEHCGDSVMEHAAKAQKERFDSSNPL